MSGPKVVRIVTEEERIAICETHIAAYTSAIQSFYDFLDKNESDNEKTKQKYQSKLDHYRNLIKQKKYQRVPISIAREIEYLKSQKEHLAGEQLQKKKSRLKRIRGLADSIKTLQMMHENRATELSKSLCLSYSQIEKMDDLQSEELQRNIATAFSELGPQPSNDRGLNDQQHDIRSRLVKGGTLQSVSEWRLFNEENESREGGSERFDTVLAELDVLSLEPGIKQAFLSRLDQAYEQASARTRSLMLDSIMLDIAETVGSHKERQDLINAIETIRLQLATLDNEEATSIINQLDRALETDNTDVLRGLLERLQNVPEQLIKQASAKAGKRALINALGELGYEVIDGMQTAVVENGQLIVKKLAQEKYAIELQPVASSNRFQVRMISSVPEGQRNSSDDVSEERDWCDDLARVKASLANIGIELGMEKAMEPGAVAIKHSTALSEYNERDRSRGSSKQRTLDRE